MTTFLFIRHAATNPGPGNVELSALGRQQAQTIARRLAQRAVDALFCSPMLCAWETALPISTRRRLPLLFDARLRERVTWGDVPNQSLSEFLALWRRCNHERDEAPPGGVSSRRAGLRVEQFVQDLHRAYPTGAVVAVTHPGALVDFLRNRFTIDQLAQYKPGLERDPYSPGILPEASLTVLTYDGNQLALLRLGDADHLARLFQVPPPEPIVRTSGEPAHSEQLQMPV